VSGDDGGRWHDQQPVIMAAGVAGVMLLALLVYGDPDPGDAFRA
jgi:hypothetical protein